MSDLIKHRGISIEKRDFVYGNAVNGASGKMYIFPLGDKLKDMDSYEVIPDTVGVFTGEYDVENKEIYKNDIVTFGTSGGKYTVVYKDAGFICISDEGDEYGLYTHRLTPVNRHNREQLPKVIGHIHENCFGKPEKIDKLTIGQALQRGYTHFTIDQTDIYESIDSLVEYGRPENYPGRKLMLLDKDKTAFSFSAETIQGLLQDHIENQEDFYCDDDSLTDELMQADFERIADLVNVGFKRRFMFPTDIELIIENT